MFCMVTHVIREPRMDTQQAVQLLDDAIVLTHWPAFSIAQAVNVLPHPIFVVLSTRIHCITRQVANCSMGHGTTALEAVRGHDLSGKVVSVQGQ